MIYQIIAKFSINYFFIYLIMLKIFWSVFFNIAKIPLKKGIYTFNKSKRDIKHEFDE